MVLPAYAGMIRSSTIASRSKSGAPRVCGDDPIHRGRRTILVQCSPRMRG